MDSRSIQNKIEGRVLFNFVLVIDCFWFEFGEIQYRFGLRIPPDTIADILTAFVRCKALVYVIHLRNVK